MKTFLIIILSIFLTSCAFLKKDNIPTVAEAKEVRINSIALEPCALLPEDIVLVTFGDILLAYGNIVNQYGDCAKKQFNSIVLLKEFGGIK